MGNSLRGGTRLGTRLGGGAVAAAFGLLAPLLTPATEAGPAGAPGLTPFASCSALRQWYVDQTIGRVGPDGWGYPVYALRAPVPETMGRQQDGASDPVTNGPTGTNVQESGVDEPDVAKTDGRIVVQVRDREVVITAATGERARQLATWELPQGVVAGGLLLVDGHALLTTSQPVALEDGAYGSEPVGTVGSDLFDLDVTDPSAPRLAGHSTWSGSVLSMRQYGDTVRLITTTGLPALPFVHPHRGTSSAEATARNRQIVRDADVDAWLPSMRADGGSRRTVGCADTYHAVTSPTGEASTTVGVFTLHPGDDSPVSSVAVTGAGSQVYSSTDRLYVWSSDAGIPLRHPLGLSGGPVRPFAVPHTDVHAFAIDGDQTRYVASGRVEGQARDSWSFDEHDGHLRIALSWPERSMMRRLDSPREVPPSTGPGGDNGIVVLDEQGDRLVTVGQLRGLGRGEQIQSVRWFDDLAVLVTFRQTDPLFTVDVADPTSPRALGALHLTGFSSYLHPLGNDRLLGLGTAATTEGETQGAKAAVFDLADARHARQLDEVSLGDGYPAAANDPHAFTWLSTGAGTGTAITQVELSTGRVALEAIHVGPDGRLTTSELPSAGGWAQRALPLDDGRLALVGDRVELVAP